MEVSSFTSASSMDSNNSPSNPRYTATIEGISAEAEDLTRFLEDLEVTTKLFTNVLNSSSTSTATATIAQTVSSNPDGMSDKPPTVIDNIDVPKDIVIAEPLGAVSSSHANGDNDGNSNNILHTVRNKKMKKESEKKPSDVDDFISWLKLNSSAQEGSNADSPSSLSTPIKIDSKNMEVPESMYSLNFPSSPVASIMPPTLSSINHNRAISSSFSEVSTNPERTNVDANHLLLQKQEEEVKEVSDLNENIEVDTNQSNGHGNLDKTNGTIQEHFISKPSFDLDEPALTEEEAKSRLEEMLRIGEQRPENFALGCFIKDSGWYIPANIRRDIWKRILLGRYQPEVPLDDVYSSDNGDKMSEKIKILEETNDAMGKDINDSIKATAAHVVFEYCMKSKIEYVRAHADLGAISMQAAHIGNETNKDGNLLYDCNILFNRLSKIWGGPSGDWSALIGHGDNGAYPAALGAAWCPWTKSVEANARRTSLFSLLLTFHDPELAKYVTKQASYLIPAAFGVLSNVDRDAFDATYFASKEGSRMILSLETRTRICDAILLRIPGFSCPQEACFFFSLGAFMLYRDDILSGNYKKGDILFPDYNDREIIYVGSKAASMTPLCYRSVLSEYELPLIPSLAKSGTRDITSTMTPLSTQNTFSSPSSHALRSTQSSSPVLHQKKSSHTSNEPPTDSSSWLQHNILIDTMSKSFSIGKDITRIITSPLTGDLSFAMSENQAAKASKPYEPFVIECNNSKSLGLDLVKQKGGLTVAGFIRDEDGSVGQVEESGKVYAGDIMLTVNGVPVVYLSPVVANSVIQRQFSPYSIVFTTNSRSIWHESKIVVPQPLLKYYLTDLYQSFNATNAETKADRVIKLYAGREAILLQEILSNYGQFLKGDPSWRSFSTVSLSVTPTDIIHHLCSKHDKARQDMLTDGKNYIFVDCRTTDDMNDVGRFKDTIRAPSDDTSSRNSIVKSILSRIASVHPQPLYICIIGSGNDALYRLYDPKRARKLFQEDRSNVDNLALTLVSKGIPLVCTVAGGFLACLTEARRIGYNMDDILVDVGSGISMDAYDSYLKFIPGEPLSTAEFITAASREFEPDVIASSSSSSVSESIESKTPKNGAYKTTPKLASVVTQVSKKARHDISSEPAETVTSNSPSSSPQLPPPPIRQSRWGSAFNIVTSATNAIGSVGKLATVAVGSSKEKNVQTKDNTNQNAQIQ